MTPDTQRKDKCARGTNRPAIRAQRSDSTACRSSRSNERENEAVECRLTVPAVRTFPQFSISRRITFSTLFKDSRALESFTADGRTTIRNARMGPWQVIDSLRRATYCFCAQFDGPKNWPRFRWRLRALLILILTPRSGDKDPMEIGREYPQQTARARIRRAALYGFVANPLRAICRGKTFYVSDHDVDSCFGIVKLCSHSQHPSAASQHGKQLLTLGLIRPRMTSRVSKQPFKEVSRTRPSVLEARRDLCERSACFAIPAVQSKLAGSAS